MLPVRVEVQPLARPPAHARAVDDAALLLEHEPVVLVAHARRELQLAVRPGEAAEARELDQLRLMFRELDVVALVVRAPPQWRRIAAYLADELVRIRVVRCGRRAV